MHNCSAGFWIECCCCCCCACVHVCVCPHVSQQQQYTIDWFILFPSFVHETATMLAVLLFGTCAWYVAVFLQTPLEAQFLANQVQLYYASTDPQYFHLLRQFNLEPDQFDYRTLIDQLQNITDDLCGRPETSWFQTCMHLCFSVGVQAAA